MPASNLIDGGPRPPPRDRIALFGLALVAAIVLGRFTLGGEALLAGDLLALHPPYTQPADPADPARWAPKNVLDVDPVLCTFPRAASMAESLRAGRGAPRWEPGLGAGEPVALMNATAPDYPPWWLAFRLLPAWVAHGAVIVVHLALALTGAFLLARRRGASSRGALVAALVYGLSGHLSVWLELEVWTIAAAWLPWALLGLELGGRRGVALAGLALGASILGGHLQVAALGCLLALAWRPRTALLAVALGLSLGAPRLLPALVELSESAREPIPFERYFEETASLTPERLRLIVTPDRDDPVTGSLSPRPPRGKDEAQANAQELRFAPGVVALALALVAASRRRNAKVALLALGVLVLAMPTPLFWPVWRFGPGFGSTTPTRVLALFPLLAGLLAAEGFDLLRERPRLVAGGLGAVLLLVLLEGFHGGGMTTRAIMKPLGLGVAALSAALLAETTSRLWTRIAGAVLVALVAFDLAEATVRWNPTCKPELLYPDRPLLEKARALAGGDRVLLDRSRGPDILLPRGLRNLGSYGSSHPARFAHLMDALAPARDGKPSRQWLYATRTPRAWRDALAVRAVLVAGRATTPTVQEGLALVTITDAQLHENPGALARARVFPERAIQYAFDEGYALGAARAIDPRRVAIIESFTAVLPPVALDPPPVDPLVATIASDEPERVVVRATATEPSVLVLMDTWASGWRATLDGAPVSVLHANVAFRGVRLPPGEHEVVFTFTPPLSVPACVLAVAALVIMVCMSLRGRSLSA